MKSNQVDLRKLSDDIGISVENLKKILDGRFSPQEPLQLRIAKKTLMDRLEEATRNINYPAPPFLEEVPNEHVEISSEDTETLQQIAGTNDPASLFEILEQLDYTDAEYIVAYEKLVRIIARQTNTLNDLNSLDRLLSSAPAGSPEEKALIENIKLFERRAIDMAGRDYNKIIALYQDDDFSSDSKRYAADRLLQISTSYNQTEELLEKIFPDDSLEYYQTIKKHKELLKFAIGSLRKGTDPSNLAETIDDDSDEMLYLAQQLVLVNGRDAHAIWSFENLFFENSEALELLATGALNQCTNYSESTIELIDSILDEFSSSSRIGRLATKHRNVLVGQYISTERDVTKLHKELSNLDIGHPLKKQLEENIINLTTDKDALYRLIDEDAYIGTLAQKKLSALLKQEQGSARKIDNISTHSKYIESDSTDEDAFDLRIVQLASSEQDVREYGITDASYAMYQMAKRFGPKSGSPASKSIVQPPIIIEPQSVELTPEEDLIEQENKRQRLETELNRIRLEDTEIKRKISKCNSVENAMIMLESFPATSEYRTLIYKRASGLLDAELSNIRRKEECAIYLEILPSKTEEWAKVIQKISVYYPRPWYKFW